MIGGPECDKDLLYLDPSDCGVYGRVFWND